MDCVGLIGKLEAIQKPGCEKFERTALHWTINAVIRNRPALRHSMAHA